MCCMLVLLLLFSQHCCFRTGTTYLSSMKLMELRFPTQTSWISCNYLRLEIELCPHYISMFIYWRTNSDHRRIYGDLFTGIKVKWSSTNSSGVQSSYCITYSNLKLISNSVNLFNFNKSFLFCSSLFCFKE